MTTAAPAAGASSSHTTLALVPRCRQRRLPARQQGVARRIGARDHEARAKVAQVAACVRLEYRGHAVPQRPQHRRSRRRQRRRTAAVDSDGTRLTISAVRCSKGGGERVALPRRVDVGECDGAARLGNASPHQRDLVGGDRVEGGRVEAVRARRRVRRQDAHARVAPAHASHRLRGLVAVRQHPDVVGRPHRARVPQPVAEEVDVAVVDLHKQRRVEDAAEGGDHNISVLRVNHKRV